MLRRFLTWKPLRYTLGLALLSHLPKETFVTDRPWLVLDKNLSVWEKCRWNLAVFPLHSSQKEPILTFAGFRALYRAAVIPISPGKEWIYHSTGLPAFILQMRTSTVIVTPRRPVGGY